MPKVTLTNRSFTATTLVKIFAPWDVQTWNQIWKQHESEVCTVDCDSMLRFGITTYMRVIQVFKQILEYVTHTHIVGNLTISCLLSHLPTSCYIRALAVLATLELVHHGWACSGSRAEICNPQICICPQSNGSTRHSGQPDPEGKKVMMQHLGQWSKNCHDQKLRIHQLSFDSCWLQLKLLAVPVTCPFFFSWELLPLPLQLELSHHGFSWMWNCSQKAWKVHLLLKLGPPGWVFISQKLQEQRWRELARLW